MESGVLEVDVVLIRPEPVDRVVRVSFAEHAPGGGRTLLHRVLPVLDSHSFLETPDGNDWPRRPRRRCLGRWCAQYSSTRIPLLISKPLLGGEVDDRFNADPDNREITIDPTTAFRDDPLDARVSLKARDDIVEERFDAVLVVDADMTSPTCSPRTRNNGVGDGSMHTTSTPF